MRKRIVRLVIKVVLLFIVLSLFLPFNVQASSFDCSKAANNAEKIICADEDLSKLDEEMAKIYERALPKAPDSSVVKEQQREWLKERDLCSDSSCLKGQYQLRIAEVKRIIDLIPLSDTEESHYFEYESEKLKVIRDIVRRQSFRWYHPYMKEPEYCTEFKRDFIKGEHLVAVEPDFRTNNPNDKKFEALNRCLDARVHPNESVDGEFWGVKNLGGPPFRFYSLDVDNNPANGKEYILYIEPIRKNNSDTGYVWIDSNECLIKAGAGQGTMRKDNQRKLYRFTTLAKYKGELIMVGIDPSPGSPSPTAYEFNMWRFDKEKHLLECAFDPN